MHEMGIAMQIIEIAASSIPDELKDVRIKKVNVKIGKLSAVVPDSLRFCFEIAVKDTRLSGAELNIEEIPVTARCRECSKEQTIHDPDFKCVECGSGSMDFLSGRELDITSIEVQ
jgi:hydrogenase nickel incorporation protein HypA/HybF